MNRPQPPTDPHADHDRLLIAAFVAGDLEGLELDRARALVASCEGCSALAGDLAAMTVAFRSLPAPRRPRDFRLTPEQAAAADRRGLRRFLSPGRPGLAFARPLGSAFAALGVAGLLFTSVLGGQLAVLPSGAGTSALAPGYAATQRPETAASGGTDTQSRTDASAPIPAAQPSAAASPAAADQGAAGGSPTTPPPVAAPSSKTAVVPPSTAEGSSAGGIPASPGTVPAPPGGVPILPVASVAVLLAGLGLLGADLVVRRR